MGQFTLGLRSLLVKAAIFVVMAALLAWALGGTLWPRPHIVELRDLGANLGPERVFWRLVLESRIQDSPRWRLMIGNGEKAPKELDARTWSAIAGPISVGQDIFFGGQTETGRWQVSRLNASSRSVDDWPMPDRLAVEQQLARLAAGLPLQDAQTINRQRAAVLDPGTEIAEEH